MRRPRALARVAMFLAVLAFLATAGPAAAHPVSPAAAEVLRASTPEVRSAGGIVPVDPAAPDGSSSRLLAVIVLGLVGVGFGVEAARRHPRRALVLALGLLLTIFAFEGGLHSVHHGFDAKQYRDCTIAAATANLSAVSVDGLLQTSIVLIAAAPAAELDPAGPPARLLEPHQGRAPPLASA